MSFNDYIKEWYKVDLQVSDPVDGKLFGETANILWNYFSSIELEGTPVEYAIDCLVLDYLEDVQQKG